MRRLKGGGWPYSQPPNVQCEINRISSLAHGLQGWWPSLASRGALILRDLALGTNLSATGTPAWRSVAMRGQVARFDDTNSDYFSGSRSAAADASGDSDFEVACWFRVNAWVDDWVLPILCGTKTGLWDSSHGWLINIYRSNVTQYASFYIYGDGDCATGGLATTTFAIGQWYLIHGWRNSSTDNIHIAFNGGASLDSEWTGSITDGATMYVGSATADNANLDWDFGDVMFWNRRLTAGERRQLYANPWELYKPLIRRWVGWRVEAPPIFPPVPGQVHKQRRFPHVRM